MSSQPLIPAAEYLRMSTEDQPNSIPLQREAIRRYAREHGFQLVATYADPGRSGVEIKHRAGLRKLIQDVVAGKPGFKAILVYDVSRWGRFQDIDESAHYEFLCRSAGVRIHYCAEQFENDDRMPNKIWKALKRTMAAEYSRELSAKVSAVMRLIALQGFRGGSTAGYGMRRMIISSDGRRKQVLEDGERKRLRADRIILVPGPANEVKAVREIFRLAARKRWTPRQIANELNRRQMTFVGRKKWNERNVRLLLKNEKYMGANVWGKTHRPFGDHTESVSPRSWTIKSGAFTPIISSKDFERVQQLFRSRNLQIKKPDSYYLNALKQVLAREGKLSAEILHKRGIFGPRTCCKRFGSMMRAYKLLGYKPSQHALVIHKSSEKKQRLRERVLQELQECNRGKLRVVHVVGKSVRPIIELEDGLRISLYVCRSSRSTRRGAPRWMISTNPTHPNRIALLCLAKKNWRGIRSFYLVPEPTGELRERRVLGEGHPLLAAGIRLDSLKQFYEAAKIFEVPKQEGDLLVRGDTVLHERAGWLNSGGKQILLSRIQARVAKVLIENAGNTVSNDTLCKCLDTPDIWRLRQHIAAIRQKLGRRHTRLLTVKPIGYTYVLRSGKPDTLSE